ncbi:MAG: TonB-dependent receptor [Bdellovibrionales bacterium]|nr:TonB-dependent receptor [Bdellovibrionales bacterium]
MDRYYLIAALLVVLGLSPTFVFGEESPQKKDSNHYAEIVVTADPLEPSLLESGHPASVLNREDIVRKSQSTIGETIGLEPGVRSSYFGPGASRPVIRGFSGDRVRVLRNGIGTGDLSNISEDHVVTVDPLSAQTIEVLRGPETLLYGSNAIGGSVNIVDGNIPELAIGKPLKGEVLMQKGDTADDERTGAIRLQGQAGELNWNLSGYLRETENIEIPGFAESKQLRESEESEEEHAEEDEARGTLPNSDTESGGFTAGGSQDFNGGFLGLAFTSGYSKYGVPGGHGHHHEEGTVGESLAEEGDEEGGSMIDQKQNRFDLRGRFDDIATDIESVKFKGGLSFYEHDEIEGSGAVGSTFKNDSAEFRTDVVHTLFGTGRGVLGTQWSYEEFSALGEEAFIQPTNSFSPSIFAFQDIPLSSGVDLHLGGRLEYVERDPEESNSEQFVPFGFSLGTEWDPTGTFDYLLALHVAYTQRAPSASELFANGPHLTRGIVEVGDSSLGTEASWGIDLTLRKNFGLITGSITPFWQIFSDYINLSGTGFEDEDLPVFRYENIDANFFGFEATTTLHMDELLNIIQDELALDVQLDYVEAEKADTNENLPRIPPLRTITRLRGSSGAFSGMVEGVFVSAQNDVAPFELETDAYSLLNVQLEVKPRIENDYQLTFFVRGSNLTDEEARVHSSFLKDQAPLRGRAFLFGIRGAL